MYYLNPALLYWAPVAALVACLLVFLNFKRKQALHKAYGEWRLLAEVSKPLSTSRYVWRGVFAAASAALLMVALARPVMPDGTRTIAQGTVDVITVVDVSRSMAAMDYEGKVPQTAVAKQLIEVKKTVDEPAGTRLEMVRHLMLDKMLKELDGNQLGIVSYAGEAFPQAFLTRDGNALRWVIDRGVTVSSAPGEGSNIAKAMELALAMFEADSKPTNERIIVLLSDGGNDSEPNDLIEQISEAKSRGIKVIVVALGNIMPSKIPVSKLAHDDDAAKGLMENGKTWYEINGQIEKTGMNVQLLQAIANAAGGQFIHLQSANDLNMLDHVGTKSKVSVKGTTELFGYALSLALLLFAASYAVTNRFSLRRDGSKSSNNGDDSEPEARNKGSRKATRGSGKGAAADTTDGASDYWSQKP